MNEHLYRSADDRIIAGVAGGLADLWDIDPSIVRIGWVILTPITGGLALLVYIVMAIVVPEERPVPGSGPGWGPAGPGWTTYVPPSGPTAADATPIAGAVAGTPPSGPGAAGPQAAEPIPGTAGPQAAGPMPGAAGPAPGSSWWSDARRADRERRRAERRAWRAQRRAEGGSRPGDAALVGGIILILIGAAVFAAEVWPWFEWHRAWPIGLIVVGGLLIARSVWPRPTNL
jgi:phage shock protein C